MNQNVDIFALENVVSNADCRKVIAGLRWKNGFTCPSCGHTKGYVLKARDAIECAKCRRQTSSTAKTAFHGMRSLVSLFHAMDDFCSGQIISALAFARRERIHYSTAWEQRHKIRTLIERESCTVECIDVPCTLLNMALVKASSESQFDINSHNRKDAHEIVSITLMPTAASPMEYIPADLLHSVLAFLLSIYHGVSRKYCQKYLAEFNWLVKQKHIEFGQLLSIGIRGDPIILRHIEDYRSPFMVRLARTESIKIPRIYAATRA
jgi:transcription elongation factor Elf1